ncbi:hypothetical protein Tco_1550575, partial [Tanacetum coccineum]
AATVSPSSRCRHQARVSTNSNLTADPDDVRVIPDGVPVEYSRGLGFSKRRLQFLVLNCHQSSYPLAILFGLF